MQAFPAITKKKSFLRGTHAWTWQFDTAGRRELALQWLTWPVLVHRPAWWSPRSWRQWWSGLVEARSRFCCSAVGIWFIGDLTISVWFQRWFTRRDLRARMDAPCLQNFNYPTLWRIFSLALDSSFWRIFHYWLRPSNRTQPQLSLIFRARDRYETVKRGSSIVGGCGYVWMPCAVTDALASYSSPSPAGCWRSWSPCRWPASRLHGGRPTLWPRQWRSSAVLTMATTQRILQKHTHRVLWWSAEVIKLIRFQLNDDAQTFEETKAVRI